MCGHPSTQKGPSSVNTAEIKIVQTRLKRAIELGIEIALVVPIDRNVPHQLHEQRTRSCARGISSQEEHERRRVEADRQLGPQTSSTGGDRVTYFFSTGRSPRVVAQVNAARPQQESNNSWQFCSTGQRCKRTLRSTKGRRKRWIASTHFL